MATALQQRRWRARQRRGLVNVALDVDGQMVAALIARGYLRPEDADDQTAVGSAIGRVVADLARQVFA